MSVAGEAGNAPALGRKWYLRGPASNAPPHLVDLALNPLSVDKLDLISNPSPRSIGNRTNWPVRAVEAGRVGLSRIFFLVNPFLFMEMGQPVSSSKAVDPLQISKRTVCTTTASLGEKLIAPISVCRTWFSGVQCTSHTVHRASSGPWLSERFKDAGGEKPGLNPPPPPIKFAKQPMS